MRRQRSLAVARSLARHAALVAPHSRAEWTTAMLSELEHLPAGASPTRWAVGCVVVAYAERMRVMTRLLPVSRWILTIEMVLCFLPPSWLFAATVFSAAQGLMPWQLALLYSSVALVGPLGLLTALGAIHFRRGALSRMALTLLALLAAWTLIGYSAQLLKAGTPASEWWRDFVLIGLLPALAVAHLAVISDVRPRYAAAAGGLAG
jgi:nitrate reductase gamma subunit